MKIKSFCLRLQFSKQLLLSISVDVTSLSEGARSPDPSLWSGVASPGAQRLLVGGAGGARGGAEAEVEGVDGCACGGRAHRHTTGQVRRQRWQDTDHKTQKHPAGRPLRDSQPTISQGIIQEHELVETALSVRACEHARTHTGYTVHGRSLRRCLLPSPWSSTVTSAFKFP